LTLEVLLFAVFCGVYLKLNLQCLFFLLIFWFKFLLILSVNLTKLEWIVLQAPIVRVFIVFGQVVVVAEARENAYKYIFFVGKIIN